MAFDKNQQDQFSINNGIDQVKQFQAELDRATASIGAAEMAAEEEQLNTKLQNLSTVQKKRLKQLEQLSDLEEEGILELAKLRQTLSEKQFNAKKKDIERELKLARDAANTLAKAENNKEANKKATSTKSSSKSTIKDIAATATKAHSSKTSKQEPKTDSQSALLEINKALNAVDGKLSELQNSVKAIRVQLGKDLQLLTSTQLSTAQTVQNILPVTPVEQTNQPQANIPQRTAEPSITIESVEVSVEQVPVITELAQVIVEPNIVVEPAAVVVEPNITVEPTPVTVENNITVEPILNVEPAAVNIEQSQIIVEPTPITVEPNIVIEPAPVSVEPAQVIVEPEITVTPNLTVESAQINVEPTPINVEPNIIVEPTPITVEAPNVVVEYTPEATEPAPIIMEPNIIVEPEITVTPNIAVEAAQVNIEPNIIVEPTIKVEPTPIILGQSKDTPVRVNTQQTQTEFVDDLILAATGVETELATTSETIATTNKLLQDIAQASSKNKKKQKQKKQEQTKQEQKKETSSKNGNGGNGTDKNSPAKGKPSDEQQYTNDASLLEKLDIGHYSAEAITNTFEAIRQSMDEDTKARDANFIKLLEQATADSVSQDTTDFAGDLLKTYKAADAAEESAKKLRYDTNEDGSITDTKHNEEVELNRKLFIAEEEHNLRRQHAEAERKQTEDILRAQAKANDLKNNREQYELETRVALQTELQDRQNSAFESLIKQEETLAFTREHREELLAARKAERENKLLEEYTEHLLEAGDYAVSLEEYKQDQARKDNAAAKKKAVGGITDGLKQFGTGNFSMTDIKKSYGEYMGQRTQQLQDAGLDESSAKLSAQFELLAEAAGGLMEALDANVRKIADMQGFIDTRLQGSRDNEKWNFSYGKQLLEEIKWIAGGSPYVKQEKIVDNLKTLVDKGISFDIKQRAFLMTIQEKIANTFDVADGTLLRLIRIQQQDTTAGRLGMESALNSFLNSMYETSEYLESVAKNVRSSLEELQALMEGKDAVELEYQVQKWMGSLYSVGMSDSAVQSIAQAFGQVASGDIGGLAGNGAGNLIIMAANEAGKSIADILQSGLDAKETNELMQAMVNYLAEIAESSGDSRVVQQQLANVYGIKASDLRAAANLSSSVKDVAGHKTDTYFDMMLQLNNMMNTIGLRTSVSEAMTNMWDNVMYSMASTQASNPILYLLPKVANLLKDVTGGDGIALPFLNVAGFGADLNTSVADLMLVASMAGTALGALGPAIVGLSDLVNPLAGSTMLMRAGINPLAGAVRVLARGSAPTAQNVSGASVSESGSLVGNSSGEDIKNATLQDAEDSKKKQMVEAKDEETADDIIIKSQQAVIDIYNLLEEVAHGTQSIRVRVINNNGCCGGGTNQDSQVVPNTGDNGNWILTM